jgi:signal transduction histidine kinase
MQTILAESNKSPQIFLNTKGVEFARQLELLTGQSVVLYDRDGAVVSKKPASGSSDSMNRMLEYSLEGKTAYLVEEDELDYLTPLSVENEQVGVIRFYYSLKEEHDFYNRIRQTCISIGAIIFFLSFILAYFYFDSFANGIIKLERMVDRVREGHYDIPPLNRKDEIGRLSVGIQAMSRQIMATMNEMVGEQEKLTQAVNKLSLLDQQQKQFIGNVTHEFKTPLTSIKAYIDLLEMYPDDDQLLETAKTTIKSETERLYEMVDKVLQLSALEKYDFEYQPEKINIKNMIVSVLQSLSGKMNKFGLELETELTEAYINADKDSLVIILVNLLDNAIKYNKVNGKVLVKNYLRDSYVWIEITDTGIGIPKEAADRIFEPFYTVDKNRSRQSGGAGLGLSLVKRYTEMQGGKIALLQSDGNGTTFGISFPLDYSK